MISGGRTEDTSARAGGLTLRQILDMPVVRRAVPEVLSGADRLQQTVRWVHAGEVPHMASLLKGGELLLTTGLGISHSADQQRRFIAELSDRGLVALAIELGSRFKTPPRALIAEARRRGLTVIVFHREIAFVEITEAVHSEIISRQLGRLRRSEEVHQRFFRLVLDGAGTTEILSALATMLGGPVFLERSGRGLIYHDSAGRDDAETLAAWDSFRRGLELSQQAIEHVVPLGDDERWGRIVAFIDDREAADADRVAVERAVEVVALALLRDREEETIRGRERGNFLTGLLRGDFREAAAEERALAMGMPPRDRLIPLIASRSPELATTPEQTTSWMQIWSDVQAGIEERRFAMVAGTREHERELLAVIGLTSEADRNRSLDVVSELIRDACESRLGDRDAVIICAGAESDSWSGLAGAIKALAEALPAARDLPVRTWHDFGMPSLERLLWSLRDDGELARFVSGRLGALVNPEGRRRDRLLETLETYCRHAGRKTETARALGIERQSLYHRLARIEDLLNVDLSDGGTLTELHFALRARRAISSPENPARHNR